MVAPAGTLSAREVRFVGALLGGAAVPVAAEAASVSERTGWRYLERAEVRAELARRSAGALSEVSARLSVAMGDALAVLSAVMGDGKASAAARVSAARCVLEAGLRLAELVTLSERVAMLEARAEVAESGEGGTLAIGGLRRGDI